MTFRSDMTTTPNTIPDADAYDTLDTEDRQAISRRLRRVPLDEGENTVGKFQGAVITSTQ